MEQRLEVSSNLFVWPGTSSDRSLSQMINFPLFASPELGISMQIHLQANPERFTLSSLIYSS